MAFIMDDVEHRLVKRGKFGPLDIYPQEDKQKEDELSSDFVKMGFKYVFPELLKEYEFHSINKDPNLFKNPNLDGDVVRTLLAIINKREENIVKKELHKKQQVPQKSQSFRPNLILITNNQKTKEAAYSWFKQLACSESLMELAKKIPVFNKRAENLPEILITLYEYQVPVTRAIWYLKIIAYSANLNEVKKIKRQQTVDVSSEWTLPLVRFMREIFYRLQFIEQYHNQQAQKMEASGAVANPQSGNPLATSNLSLESFMNVESLSSILLPTVTHSYLSEQKLNCLWQFTNQIIRAMLDQNLLDKQMVLESMLDLLEKNSNGFTHYGQAGAMHQRASQQASTHFIPSNSKNSLIFFEMNTIKLLLTNITQNMHHFLQSELLSRRLAYFSCKRLSHMFNEFSQLYFDKQVKEIKSFPGEAAKTVDTTTTSPSTAQVLNYVLKRSLPVSSVKVTFDKFLACPKHKNQLILLTSIIHAIELGCMQSLVWNSVGDGLSESPFNGSPLDYMPCPPSQLLYTYNSSGITPQTKLYVREELEKAELCIKRRSLAIENRWCIDKLRQPSVGLKNIKILEILDVLDKHCYHLADINESIETLYEKIFPKINVFVKNYGPEETNINELLSSVNGKPKAKAPEELETEEVTPEVNENPLSDKEIIFLLCDWAITTKRCGLHRIFYVVFLIRKRQIDWVTQFKGALKSKMNGSCAEPVSKNTAKNENQSETENELSISRKRKHKLNDSDETETEQSKNYIEAKKMKFDGLDAAATVVTSVKIEPEEMKLGIVAKQEATNKKKQGFMKPLVRRKAWQNRLEKRRERQAALLKLKESIDEKLEIGIYEFLFQSILLEYLETKAPFLDEESTESRLMFTNLVSLFHMFINCKLFSHDRFVCTLISRGESFKNNLNDIKRPIQAIVQGNNIKITNPGPIPPTLSQSISQQNLKLKSNKSGDYTSPYQQPASMPPYNLPPHTPLQHQKSFNSDVYANAPLSVPTPCKSSSNNINSTSNKSNGTLNAKQKAHQLKPMSKLALIVLHLPIPHNNQFQHERNQRFVVLYGFGSKKQEILESLRTSTKNLIQLFSRKSSIDLTGELDQKTRSRNKYYNTITTNNFAASTYREQEQLNELSTEFAKLTNHDQHAIAYRVNTFIVNVYKNLEQKNYLPRLQHLQFIFDLMETHVNVFNLLTFAIRLLHVGPLIEQYLRNKFLPTTANSSSRYFFEYVSYFYLHLIGVFRMHLLSLIMWKELAIEVFTCLLKVIKNVERPSKCSSHEKCALMLLNEMYSNCKFIKSKFSGQFDTLATKIRVEKVFVVAPSLDRLNLNSDKFQMKPDDKLISMITTNDYTIDEIEAYITNRALYYNFVAHVFVSISNLNKEEMLRVANLCAELSNRNNILITFWQRASHALYHRNTEITRDKTMFNELLDKIDIQNHRSRENFKLFLSILVARHCLILNEFIIMVVKTCVMACPGIMADQSHNFAILEPSAWLACHILQYLFTSSPRPLIYRHTTFDQRMLTASFLLTLPFNSFLLVLKGLFLLSDPKKESVQSQPTNTRNKSSSSRSSTNSAREKQQQQQQAILNSANTEDGSNSTNELELDQFASNVLQEICEHNWIKERCFNEGDNLLRPNQLLEPALERRAQNLLHIICYPRSHHLRKQNEQSSTKDFIKNILQNLDIWTLRESLLEFKLIIELPKQKDNYYEYFVECLAKTTVDFLIDPDKSQSTSSNGHTSKTGLARSKSVNSNTKDDDNPSSVGSNQPASDSVKSSNGDQQQDMETLDTCFTGSNNEVNSGDVLDMNKLYESDSIYNFELDKLDQPESDDLELLRIHRQNQPVGVWLIAPLITKLQDNCQLKVLEYASKTLQDLGKAFWSSKNKIEKENHAIKNITAWSQKPFFSLLISCLKSKDEQRPRTTLLNSLFNGLGEFVNGKEDKILSEDPKLKQIMIETLHVRLSLVGSMFDFILKNSGDFINWAWLFVQLIFTGVVDPDNDQLLFTMIIDMLFILIHHIITLEPNLENNKHYQAFIKKISKETKDFSDVPNTKAINHIRRLMPLSKNAYIDIMTIDPSTTLASKTFANSLDKRKGYKFLKKERVSTWELIEGVKNASSLCFSWFGSTKIERKILRYEYQQKLLIRHKHLNIHKELTYFKEKPEVPSDLIEVGQQVILPAPCTPTASAALKKDKQTPNNNNELNLSLQNTNALNHSSSSTHNHLNNSNSAEIVILGSTIPNINLNSPNAMPNNPNAVHQHPHQMNSQQHPLGQNPMQHSLIMNRLQQHPVGMQPMHPHHQQQQQQQQQHQAMHPQQQQQQQPIPQPVSERKNSSARGSSSTPDKKTGSTKKRTTTPRRNANVRGASAIAAGTANVNPLNMSAQQPLPHHQKFLTPQQQQQQQQMMQQQQRSTNSPMLMPQQQYHQGQARPMAPNNQPQQPQAHIQPTPSHQQINQRLQANINQNQSNMAQGSNYQGSNTNGSYQGNQAPPKALTPQPIGGPQRGMVPQQGPQTGRLGYPPANAQGNLNMPHPGKSTTPTLTSQLVPPGQQSQQQMDMRRKLQQQQQQMQVPGQQKPIYNTQQQGNRMVQPGAYPNQSKPMSMQQQQQQRTTTPDINKPIPPPNYVSQTQRMQFNQQPGQSGVPANGQQVPWQQQQQRQNLQRQQPQFQSQQSNPMQLQQQQYIPKPGQQMTQNPNQQPHMNIQQQSQQQQRLLPPAQQQFQNNY